MKNPVLFSSYSAAVESVKMTLGKGIDEAIKYCPESQLGDESKLGFATTRGWCQINVIVPHDKPMNLE